MSNVRTGYVALFAVACVLLLVRAVGDEPRRSTAQRRSVVLVSAILFGVFVGFGGSNTALESFSSISSDDRLTNRFEAWGSAIDAVESSPVTGHGAGAAGDTLGAEFRENGGHWTSHNVLLKWAVEGGVIGLGLVLWLLFVGLSPAVRGAGGLASPAGVVVVLLAAFGMTGAIIEAMPVSFFLLTLAAASVQETPSARTAQGCELSDVMADPNRRQRT